MPDQHEHSHMRLSKKSGRFSPVTRCTNNNTTERTLELAHELEQSACESGRGRCAFA
jgi:hypothetical protein